MDKTLVHGLAGRYIFGPFELRAAERLLLHEGAPIALGSRAMDILLCLIEREGELVGPDELLDRVWRGVRVESAALRVHLSALRKVLANGDPGTRYVSNVAGRGYCFSARVGRIPVADARASSGTQVRPSLPAPPRRMIGRDSVVDDLEQLAPEQRLISIVGPGGIGKTTVALSMAQRRLEAFDDDVVFVDLAIEQDDCHVANAVALALGLTDVRGNVVTDLQAHLRTRRLLLILDGCEHVTADAAALAEAIRDGAPQVHILATSREPLNVPGELVHRLPGLETPSAEALSFEEVCAYSAAQLFIDRVAATGCQLTRGPVDARLIGEICRRLDGIPLALELVAGRVEAFGLATILSLLDTSLRLSWPGRRTAAPRHVTLNAALDWSYNLLNDDEAGLLRALSAFVGPFTLAAAEAVADDDQLALAAANLPGLVSKSLVSADPRSADSPYRLLDTTRVYAAARLASASDRDQIARRHGVFALRRLRGILDSQEKGGAAVHYFAAATALAEVREALAWALHERHDLELGIQFAAAAALALLKTSQFVECQNCCQAALAALPDDEVGQRPEMELQTCLGLSRMLTGGGIHLVEAALTRGLELAEQFEEARHIIPLLGALSVYRHRAGDARQALALAERAERIAQALDDPASLAMAHDMLATAHGLIGAHRTAARYCAAVLQAPQPAGRVGNGVVGLEYRNRAFATLARIHWLNGRYSQAVAVARHAVEEAALLQHPVSEGIAISAVLPIFLWLRDLDTVVRYVERLRTVSERYNIRHHLFVSQAFHGAALVAGGDAARGVQVMETAFECLTQDGARMTRILLGPDYIQGLVESGALGQALAEVDRAQRLLEDTGYYFNLPELLRLEGEILRRLDCTTDGRPGKVFLRALAKARRQDALSWALSAAVGLLEIRSEERRPASAARLVSGLLAQLPDATATPDRIRALRLLEEVGMDVQA